MTFVAGQRLTAAALNSAFAATTQLISKQVLGGSAASVLFGGIPQTFTNLRLVIAAKGDGTTAAGYDPAVMQFNGVSSASYGWNSIFSVQGGAATNASGTSATSMQVAEIWNAHFGSMGRGVVTIEIPNYSDTINVKGFTSICTALDGGNVSIQQWYSGALGGGTTAAITSLAITMGVGNFVADSTFCLYGS